MINQLKQIGAIFMVMWNKKKHNGCVGDGKNYKVCFEKNAQL